MTHPAATRFLAARYASLAAHRSLDAQRRADAGLTLDALQELGLLDAPDGTRWRARLERLGEDPAERALLPEAYRERAQALLADGDVRRALEAVGALTWHDAGAEPPAPLGLVVDRVIVAPAQPRSNLTIASLVLFDDSLQVHWYAAASGTGVGLQPSDDVGTRYHACGSGSGGSSERGCSSPGHSAFRPAPPDAAAFIDLSAGGEHLVRVPLV